MVWFCAYRDWALDVFTEVQTSFPNMKLIKDNKEFQDKQKLFKKDDIIFFIGWSWILPKDIVEKYKCICLHPSPLPKYRGGSPIQNQVVRGESDSAVSFFRMTDKLDAGDIFWQKPFSLSGNLNDILLRIRNLAPLGIIDILNGDYTIIKQDETQKSYFSRRKPSDSKISLNDIKTQTAKQLYDKIRCLQDPYPNAYIVCGDGKKLYFQLADYEK